MRRGPKKIADILGSEIPLDQAPCSVNDLSLPIILKNQWAKNESEALELAEKWEKRILTDLQRSYNDLLEIGRTCRFTFNSSTQEFVQGSCFIERNDSSEIIEAKKRRVCSDEYYSILYTLSPSQFECLCGGLISEFGLESVTVTKISADEGIDFFGKLSFNSIFFPNDLTSNVQQQMQIWFIGQAKHYLNIQSGTPELRDLVGSISLARSGAFGSLENPYKSLKIRAVDPVFALFVTTGTISANAWRLLKRSGVLGMDGEMVASFLADREVGKGHNGFCKQTFFTWLNKQTLDQP